MNDYEGAAQQPSIKIDQNSKGECIVSVRVTPEPQPDGSLNTAKMPMNAVDLWLETCARLEESEATVAGDPNNSLCEAYWFSIGGSEVDRRIRDESESSEG